MTHAEFMTELDGELDWRLTELRRLGNLVSGEGDESIRGDFRKAMIVVLYSHFEGFCVFALQHYRLAVNRAGLSCHEATHPIMAGAWDLIFHALQTGDEKCRVFRQTLPNDLKLHLHWRRRHFIEEIERLGELPVEVPEEIIDAESNLKPAVLKRNLFVLGLDHGVVDPYVEAIQRLLKTRNAIAHGDRRKGVPDAEYLLLESAVVEVCRRLVEVLDDAHRHERYRRDL